MSGFGQEPFGTTAFGVGSMSLLLEPSVGFAIPGADYSKPVDFRGTTLGEEIWFVTSRGDEVNLSTIIDEQYKAGITGRWSAPVEHFSQAVPEQDGERYRGTRIVPNQITIPITLVANDLPTLRGKARELSRALNPKLGRGKLHVVTQDGLHRTLTCILEEFDADDPGVAGEEYDAAVNLVFRAHDPFWYDLVPTEREWRNTSGAGTFFPGPPFRFGASSVFTTQVEINEGDTDAWPKWLVRGPGQSFKFTNETTGEWSALNFDIAAGDAVVIDTRPGSKEVYRYGAQSQTMFPYFDGSLWPLVPGENRITVNMLETDSRTLVEFSYNPGFLGV